MYANDYAPRDGVLRLHLLANDPAVRKGDAYLITCDGVVVLLDGGMVGDTTAYAYLLRLREGYLRRAPAGTDAPLRIIWVVSHFHHDHVGAPEGILLRDRRIALEAAYLPPATVLDPRYPKNGDLRERVAALATLARFHPDARVHLAAFGGDAIALRLGGATLSLLPPDLDWGTPDRAAAMQTLWGLPDGRLAVGIVNATSQWALVRYAGRSALFTGDTMKREPDAVEPFDTMLARWQAQIGTVDFLKWPHHGYVRDRAAEGLAALAPRLVFFNHPDATAAALVPRGTATVNHGARSYLIEVSADGGVKCGWVCA